MLKDRRFNIRVYGLLIQENQILVCREERMGLSMLKFPGGGLQWGEGLVEALQREWQEETSLSITEQQHFYTTDFFQASAFNPNDQLISIYFKVQCPDIETIMNYKHDINDGKIFFTWMDINSDLLTQLTFPIDKYVIQKLLEY